MQPTWRKLQFSDRSFLAILIFAVSAASGPLAITFLTLLLEGDQLPRAICFYTEGVKLVSEGSPVLDLLQALEARRVPLIVCQTCLNHFQLADKLKAGLVGGMGDIIAAQAKAAKVITL